MSQLFKAPKGAVAVKLAYFCDACSCGPQYVTRYYGEALPCECPALEDHSCGLGENGTLLVPATDEFRREHLTATVFGSAREADAAHVTYNLGQFYELD